jgi:hypothetical protein
MKIFKTIKEFFTPPNTIMWIQVPMSANSIDDKTDIIIATINQLEQTIKIDKNG